jgi:hypothetical protein
MRLTLRTLLAWLDNLLSPQDQQVLGDKVAQSPDAARLIRRIRETVARGTLPSPRLDGSGLAHDPNKAAEYLDNTLEPDLLAEFEKICIQSDVHLAEIAASHALLAEVFRDPGLVQPLGVAEKKRLLQAVQQHLEKPREAEREVAAARGESVPPAPSAAAEACDTVFVSPATLATAQPGQAARAAVTSDTKRRSRRAAWLTLASAAAVLLTLVGVLIWSLSRGDKREIAVASPTALGPQSAAPPAQEPADEHQQPAEPVKPAADVRAAPAQPASPPTESPAPRTNAAADAGTAADRPAAEAAAAPVAGPPARDEKPDAAPPGADTPAGTATAATPPPAAAPLTVEQPRVPQGDALAIAAAPPAVRPAGPPSATPATQPTQPAAAAAVLDPPAPAAAVAASGIVLDRGLLLRRDPANAGQNSFEAVASGGEIKPGDDLLAPAACRPVISVGGVQVVLEPNSRAAVTRDADGTPRLELLFGRVTARAPAAAARLGVTAGGLSGVITAGLRAPVGIEVSLAVDANADPAESEARTTARIVTGSSAIAWQQTQADGAPAREPLQGIAPQGMLDTAAALVWDSHDPGGVVVQRRSATEWVPGQERSDRIEDAAGQALQAAVAGGKPVEETLRALVGDRRSENRMAAAATLALLGDYGPLVDLLCAESGPLGLRESEWGRLEQSTVPLALARGAKSAARLQQAFEAKLPDGGAAELFALARGIGAAAVAADGGRRLVAALESDRLVVRRYAFKNLVDIVRPSAVDRLRYLPDRPPEQRREGVDWWRRQLADGRIRHSPASGDSGAPPVE